MARLHLRHRHEKSGVGEKTRGEKSSHARSQAPTQSSPQKEGQESSLKISGEIQEIPPRLPSETSPDSPDERPPGSRRPLSGTRGFPPVPRGRFRRSHRFWQKRVSHGPTITFPLRPNPAPRLFGNYTVYSRAFERLPC